MSIFIVFRGKFIDIVEWTEPTKRHPRLPLPAPNNEIKMGGKLVVREGQTALFVNEGQLTDIFLSENTYTLTTQNLPILSTLKGWKYGFNSPFKAEVYFISMRPSGPTKSGARKPIMMRDRNSVPSASAPSLLAFHVADPATFLKQLSRDRSDVRSFRNLQPAPQHHRLQIRRLPGHRQNRRARSGRQLRQNQQSRRRSSVKPDLAGLGLSLTSFLIENISLPPEVEQAMDQRTKMGVLGDLNKYTQFQTAQAIGDAAKNPGGMSGLGAGIAAGSAMADQMRNAMNAGAAAAAAPPPIPQSTAFFIAVNGQQQGPFDVNTLASKVKDGSFTRAYISLPRQGITQFDRSGTGC